MIAPLRSGLVAVALVMTPLAALAQSERADEPPAAYTGILEQALEESAASRWLEARALFRQAQSVYPNARALRAIGMASFELRDYVAAYGELGAALTEPRRALTASQTEEVRALLARIRPLVGVYTLDSLAPGARLVVDGIETPVPPERRLVFAPGRHSVEVRGESGRRRGEWTVQGGEDEPLVLRSDDEAPTSVGAVASETMPTTASTVAPPNGVLSATPTAPAHGHVPALAIASYSAAGGALVAGAAFLALGRHDEARVQDAAVGTPWSALEHVYDRGVTRERVGASLLAASALLGGAGVMLTFLHPRADAPSVQVSLLPNGVHARVRW